MKIALVIFPTIGGLLVAGWMALMAREGQTGLGVSVRRGGRVVVPRGNTQLLPGDHVIALTNPGGEAGMRRALTRGDGQGGPS